MNNKETKLTTLKKSYHLHDPRLAVVLKDTCPTDFCDGSLAINYGIAQSPFGEFFIADSPLGINWLHFTDGKSGEIINKFRTGMGCNWTHRDDTSANKLARKILDRSEREELHVCTYGTPFQLEVWTALMDIPFGETATYSDIAERIGKPEAVRAVASAIAQNHIAYIIPCHRVIHKDGSLGEYRWGGTKRKALMLAWEKKRREDLEKGVFDDLKGM